MNADQQALARSCFDGAYDGSMSFPEIVGALQQAGFDGYDVDLRRGSATYYLPDGEGLDLGGHGPDGPVAGAFDAAALRDAIREAQTLAPGYTYAGFCAKAKAAGCAGYHVSFPGRRVLYYGRTAETHTERFPGGD